ncbi:hypothetical protein [Streptomyces pseudovenezuelae]|uniref:hypothetical protein n=1 Tax=Streptomyces pseudovenezuelae TaxID=67350 RepID=UPI002E8120EC|nr:hypothetical protein [Streptomyces pseudovenezuelae]WUA94424.1 hypothetical protein OHO81_45105 [Streptomyces pseudovenezuelae]
MAEESSPSMYKPFACGRDCHHDRYVIFTVRTWWGRKRWGIHDNHMGVNLTRLCKSFEAAESWRFTLAMMELRERQAIQQAPGLREMWTTR